MPITHRWFPCCCSQPCPCSQWTLVVLGTAYPCQPWCWLAILSGFSATILLWSFSVGHSLPHWKEKLDGAGSSSGVSSIFSTTTTQAHSIFPRQPNRPRCSMLNVRGHSPETRPPSTTHVKLMVKSTPETPQVPATPTPTTDIFPLLHFPTMTRDTMRGCYVRGKSWKKWTLFFWPDFHFMQNPKKWTDELWRRILWLVW